MAVSFYTTEAHESSGGFRPHGTVSYALCCPGVVQLTATGPFNEELLDAVKDVEPKVEKAAAEADGRFVKIVVFRESALITAEGIEQYAKLLDRNRRGGLAPCATAIVIGPEVEGGLVMKPVFEKLYGDAGIPQKQFSDFDAAMEWLRGINPASDDCDPQGSCCPL